MGFGIGKIIRHVIQKNRDAAAVSRMYEVEGDEADDGQEMQSIQQPGFQSRAPVDSDGFFGRISAAYKVLIGFDDKVAPIVIDPGETVVYASSASAVACKIHCKADGSIDVAVPGDLNIIGNLNVTGDVTADSLITAISLLTHYHQGNLGYPTGVPIITGGGTTPSPAPSVSAVGDLLTGAGVSLDTLKSDYDAHKHSQGNDSGTDTEVDTSTPI